MLTVFYRLLKILSTGGAVNASNIDNHADSNHDDDDDEVVL